MNLKRLRRQVRLLALLQACTLLLVVLLLKNQPTLITETKNNTVYTLGAQGPQGIPGIGLAGKDGLSIVGPPGQSIKGDKGDSAPPCTTQQDEQGTTTITCPDGSSSSIARPKDGEDGQDGRTVEFMTDPETCDVYYRYEGERGWTVLVDQECTDEPD